MEWLQSPPHSTLPVYNTMQDLMINGVIAVTAALNSASLQYNAGFYDQWSDCSHCRTQLCQSTIQCRILWSMEWLQSLPHSTLPVYNTMQDLMINGVIAVTATLNSASLQYNAGFNDQWSDCSHCRTQLCQSTIQCRILWSMEWLQSLPHSTLPVYNTMQDFMINGVIAVTAALNSASLQYNAGFNDQWSDCSHRHTQLCQSTIQCRI